ncbi:MAG: hypothetical protein RLZZ142_896 [Verrucomicrobiota bacterium]|jgi:hypothetical protein
MGFLLLILSLGGAGFGVLRLVAGFHARLAGGKGLAKQAWAQLESECSQRQELALRAVEWLRPLVVRSERQVWERTQHALERAVAARRRAGVEFGDPEALRDAFVADSEWLGRLAEFLEVAVRSGDPGVVRQMPAVLKDLDGLGERTEAGRSAYNEAARAYNRATTVWRFDWPARFLGFTPLGLYQAELEKPHRRLAEAGGAPEGEAEQEPKPGSRVFYG